MKRFLRDPRQSGDKMSLFLSSSHCSTSFLPAPPTHFFLLSRVCVWPHITQGTVLCFDHKASGVQQTWFKSQPRHLLATPTDRVSELVGASVPPWETGRISKRQKERSATWDKVRTRAPDPSSSAATVLKDLPCTGPALGYVSKACEGDWGHFAHFNT